MRLRSGCEGGGKGPLCQTEKSATLATHNDQYLFQPEQSDVEKAGMGIDGYNGEITGDVAATLGVNCGMSTGRNGVLQFSPAIQVLNDQGGASLTVERGDISPTLRSQTHGNLPVVALGFDLQQITSKANGTTLKTVQPTLCGAGNPHVICIATGQANAGIMGDASPTLTAAHEHPIVTYPKLAGTLCASGAGLSRPAGQGNELDFCIMNAGFKGYAGSQAGSVGYQEEKAPTLIAGQKNSVLKAGLASDLNGGDAAGQQRGFILVNVNGGWQRWELIVRRLTPVECERLQGFPDGWTEYGSDGKRASDTARYQMLGNSVAVPCVAYLMQGIRAALETR